jgi:crotonobetainyl-CoA:carnitine CoA-transferase CaiB-like acyl-CoA transferase
MMAGIAGTGRNPVIRHITTSSAMTGALSHLTILDFSRVLAGPYASMLLGDLGARVIKIEQPGLGDDTRRWGPPFSETGESAYFLCANRNKESVTLNLKHPQGRDIALALMAQADVVLENFKVGAMDSLGLGYPMVQSINPQLVYCSITGYGQTGPYRHRPGYDAVIQAEGGIMSVTGPADAAGEPTKVGVAIVDVTAGMQAALAILAALNHRDHGGGGQYIDISLLDTQVGWLANVASSYLVTGERPQRYGNAHSSIVPYQTMPASDGYLMLAVGNDHQFACLCRVLERPQWAEDSRFATNPARVAHRNELITLLEECFCRETVQVWTDRLNKAGVPCGPVNDIPTVLADRHVIERGMVQHVRRPNGETIPQIGPVPKLSATPAAVHAPPPLLGEHTRAILSELLGLDEDRITQIATDGVI